MITQTLRPGEKEGAQGADWSYVPPAAGITNSTADVVAKAAVAGQRNYVSALLVSQNVLANATVLEIKDGATVIARFALGTAANIFNVPLPKPLVGSVNTALNFATPTIFATGNLLVQVFGYTV